MIVSDDDANAREFFLTEYQAIQERHTFARNDLVRTETVAPLAVAVIISWGLAQDDLAPVDRVAVFLMPVIITVVSYLRFRSRFRLVLGVEDYLRKLETCLSKAKAPGGYENFYRSTRAEGRAWPMLLASRYLMWLSMALGTGYLFIASLIRAH